MTFARAFPLLRFQGRGGAFSLRAHKAPIGQTRDAEIQIQMSLAKLNGGNKIHTYNEIDEEFKIWFVNKLYFWDIYY